MITVDNITALREQVRQARLNGRRIAFVPTMGNLHAGHMSLIATARQHADFVVASIFVNPLQFGPNEDLDSYPRTLAADQDKLAAAGCALLFTPTDALMYPNGMDNHCLVHVPEVSEGLCGGSRPGHFDGVATVVTKLFNMVQPDLAVFGEKDYQQLTVIRKMVSELNIPVQIIGAPIVRDSDGLALSSRNGYLDAAQRKTAPALHGCLQQSVARIRSGRRDYAALLQQAAQELTEAGMQPDYLELREADSLQPANADSRRLVMLAAAFLGNTRLIDNIEFDVQP
ncbi:pantoate--beta-alanine ligase [Thiopseudomonas denitrificans]|uniref:Pantothenate synthetase n=1 Tax=Thiopseudomonas denitrificans TaxID=1501432 RepID=A0A4R6U8G8_9GAMM|nr:pantoate--beta-alanine ligase [Thiopseudomonas denitrificans]TDQ39354.1 pantothenate synthetase [Thiopseudomonas denitrificans]